MHGASGAIKKALTIFFLLLQLFNSPAWSSNLFPLYNSNVAITGEHSRASVSPMSETNGVDRVVR